MPEPSRRYVFGPLERRGVLLGLQLSQLGVLGGGAVVAFVVLQALGGEIGVAAAVVLCLLAAAGALWPHEGVPLAGWTAVAVGWGLRRAAGPRLSAEPLRGSAVAGAGDAASSRPVASRRRPDLAPPGIEVLEIRGVPGSDDFGAVRDRRTGYLAALVGVRGGSFTLSDPEEQVRRLEGWRSVLGSLGRPGSPVRRVQWVLRSGLSGNEEVAPALSAVRATGDTTPGACESYAELVAASGAELHSHDVWLVVAVGGAARGRPSPGRASESLGREMRLLAGHIRDASLRAGPPLAAGELRDLLGSAYAAAPLGRRGLATWPLASDEAWGCLRAGAAWHATYWIAEWPRVEVGPDFLGPLLFADGTRTVSVVMGPVPLERAMREARSARTADVADEELRTRAGFVSSARRGREAEGVTRREEELAVGHADFRFSGYVTVSAGDRPSLDVACAEAEHAAQAARLDLRRLYGRQAEAFTWTLPLARGLS